MLGDKVTKGALGHTPDYAIPPGETLQEVLESIGMTQKELADRTGRAHKTINEIVKGKEPISPETALLFERVFDIAASFWNNLERNYQESLARIAERGRLGKHLDWLRKFPVGAMVKRGWLEATNDKVKQLTYLLNYFGVATPDQLGEVLNGVAMAYRRSTVFQGDHGARAAWLRQGVLLAQKVKCQAFNRDKFAAALAEFRGLTRTEDPQTFIPKVQELCADAGVAVVFVQELPKTCTSGVTLWLSPEKAMILCSFRYGRLDSFWFTLFHEAGHILLHGKKDVFYEGKGYGESDKEIEANVFAQRQLVDERRFAAFLQDCNFDERSIVRFAKELGIHPAIVVGRLRHEEKLLYHERTNLVPSVRWL